jgi:hypothetical protein
MHEPISLPRMKLYLYQLRGSLKCTFTRNGGAAKVYHFSESDLGQQDATAARSIEETHEHLLRIDASAVGFRIRLLKNSGVLKIKFCGKDGAMADWTSDGLALAHGGRMMAAAASQTFVDADKCLLCSRQNTDDVEIRFEEVQPDILSLVCPASIQTIEPTTSSNRAATTSQYETSLTQMAAEIMGPFKNETAIADLLKMIRAEWNSLLRRPRPILARNLMARADLDVLFERTGPRRSRSGQKPR